MISLTPSPIRALLVFVCACAIASSAYAGCTLPPAPSKIPDGATASDDVMRVTMIAMSDFETDVNNYIKCLEFETTQGRLTADAQVRLRDAALSSHQAVLTRFNAQMRVYMAR
jgi:hypothetical protein